MDKYVIDGGGRLCGSVRLQSAKNSVLPLFAASVLTQERVVIRDAPHISDVACMAQILKELGARVVFRDGDAVIDSARAAITARELIKAHVLNNANLDTRETMEDLADMLGAELVQVIGHYGVLFKKKDEKSHFDFITM